MKRDEWDEAFWDALAHRQEDLLVDFSIEAIQEEISQGQTLEKSWLRAPSAHAYRIYSESEQQVLPLAVRDYLAELETAHLMTPFHREWAVISAQAYAKKMQWPEIPMALMTSLVFLIQSISHLPTSVLDMDSNIADADELVTLS